MNKFVVFAGLAIAASGASADFLLDIDLSNINEVTISAKTGGLSSQTVSGSNFTGFLLADFFANAGTPGSVGSGTGNLTTFNDPSDFSPSLFQGGTSRGLNIWSFSTNSTVSFTAGTQAFTGSGTWTLTAIQYAEFLAGATSGDIFFPADTDDDIPFATLIGSYRVIPAPGALALLGMGGLVVSRRRR